MRANVAAPASLQAVAITPTKPAPSGPSTLSFVRNVFNAFLSSPRFGHCLRASMAAAAAVVEDRSEPDVNEVEVVSPSTPSAGDVESEVEGGSRAPSLAEISLPTPAVALLLESGPKPLPPPSRDLRARLQLLLSLEARRLRLLLHPCSRFLLLLLSLE